MISKAMMRKERLPSLIQAYRIQEKAAAVGFDWTGAGEIVKKIREELREVKETLEDDGKKELSNELGDLLFSVVNLARFKKVDPERSLRGATRKFIRRFAYIEHALKKRGKGLGKATLPEMEACWEESKRKKTRRRSD